MLEDYRLQHQKTQSSSAKSKPVVKRVLTSKPEASASDNDLGFEPSNAEPSANAPAKRRRRRKPKSDANAPTSAGPGAEHSSK